MWNLQNTDDNLNVSLTYTDDYDDDYSYYQAKGFEHYTPKTINPGPWLLLITTITCISSIYILPCLVILGKRRKSKQTKLDEEVGMTEKNDTTMDEETKTTNHDKPESPKSILSGVESNIAYSAISNKSNYTFLSNGVAVSRRRRRHRGGVNNRHRHYKENKEYKLLKYVEFERNYEEQQELLNLKKRNKSAAMRKKWSDVQSDLGPVQLPAPSPTSSFDKAKSEVAGDVSFRTNPITNLKQRYPILHKRTPSPTQSYLSKIIDDISPNDAADADDPGVIPPCTTYTVDSTIEADGTTHNSIKEYSICCGTNPLWHPKTIKHALGSLITLSEYDAEMARLIKLTIPFAFNCIFEAGMEVIFAILIGRLMGTDALTTYVVVDIFLGTTAEFIGGVIDAQVTLLSHAIGAGNNYLAGQYVQLSTSCYVLLQIPAILFWRFAIHPLMLWLGFPVHIATYAQAYANVAVFNDLVEGVSEGVHSILEVTDHENFSATSDLIQGICNLGLALGIIFIKGPQQTTLMDLAYMDLGMELLFTLITIVYAGFIRIWLKPFFPGMFGNFAFRNMVAVKNVISTAVPLSIGSLLSYGEWEILTIFSSFMGPAEVTVWSILGTIWDTFEATTEGIGDAAEVRVAYHLGKGNPDMARRSSSKSIYIGVIISFLITSIFFMIGNDLSSLFTKDPTLTFMINQLLPFIGIGNIAMTFGLVCWALIGGQGRYKLATIIQFVSSWGITMPLAAIMTYVCKFNLKGITASVIIGYMCTGVVMSYVILTSDWKGLSRVIMEINAVTGECESSDDEESSGSSSSSSSSSSISSSDDSDSSSSSDDSESKDSNVLLAYRSVGSKSAISSKSNSSSSSSSSSSKASSSHTSNISSINIKSNSSGSTSYGRKMLNVDLLSTSRSESSSSCSSKNIFVDEEEEPPTPIIKNVKDILRSR